MKKVFGFVFAILLFALVTYIFLLSPSKDETEGDRSFAKEEFRGAVVFYTRALAKNKTPFSEERILFKLGNSYRLAGENQRAFDFYFSILRKNEDSVYRDRIQSYLRHEAKDLEMETSLGDIELKSISLGESVDESILDLKTKRDKLYLKLLKVLLDSAERPQNYQLLDLYNTYKSLQTKYLDSRQSALKEFGQVLERKISKKFVSLWMGEAGVSEFSPLTDLYKIEHIVAEDWATCFSINNEPPVDAFFIYVSEKVQTNLLIQVSRLYDFHEKAKVFLVFDDSTLESLPQEKVKSLADKASLLQCTEENTCAEVIRQLIHRRSLWQSDG
tara:strand:- start:1856 stop:2845 length:990 start_codon:yes stop_codon:yes gene_type:complete